VVALAGLAAALAACAGHDDGDVVVGATSAPPTIYPVSVPPVEAPAAKPTGVAPVAAFVMTSDGVALPDPTRTPGATFDGVDATMICQQNYSQGVRQPRFNDKVEAFAAYGVSIHDRESYQVDHLVPISLGGSNASENLWPQPYDPRAGAEQKDLLERQLRGLVCSQVLTLADAQAAIAKDWWAAYQTSMGKPILPGSDGPAPPKPPDHAPGEVVNGGPCDAEGALGYTEPKRVPLTCTKSSSGDLRWQKRY
jgi:hypothetical protein